MPTTAPAGDTITISQGRLNVPDHPVIPFIEGDGTGPDIWRASVRVFDAAVQKAYGGKRKIAWHEVLAGEKSFKQLNTWLPDETVQAFDRYLVGIKGPLTTPVGGGISWEGRRLVSDVDESVAEVAGWVTPRLGGVGPTTVAMLLRNAVDAAARRRGLEV